MSKVRLSTWFCPPLRLTDHSANSHDSEFPVNHVIRAVSNLLARVFAVWTLVTCMITLACAFRLDSFDIVAITTASFAIALSFFLIEWAVFGTMLARNLLGPGIIAGVSVVWLIRWMYMHHGLLATV